MDLSKISNQELITKLSALTGTERETTLSILYHLIELDNRNLVFELGYSSLFDYCIRGLGYSDTSAYRRYSAANAIKLNPELGELFLQGKVTLCTISLAARSLREKKTVVAEIVNKSKTEVKALLAPVVEIRPRETIKPVVVNLPSTPLVPEVKEERYEIKFSVSKEVFEQFNEARRKLSNSLSSNQTVEGAFTKLLQHYLAPKERKVLTISGSRYIPRSLRRKLFERDHGQCCYISNDGVRCRATKFLHVDHIVPYAKGGKTELSNLRLLCSAHNKHCAEVEFGKKFIQRKIEEQLTF